MEQFSGMCVGGPKDGEFMVGHAPCWEVAIMPALMCVPCTPIASEELSKATFHKVRYHHRHFKCDDGKPLNFWVDEAKASWPLSQILYHALSYYSAPEAEKK